MEMESGESPIQLFYKDCMVLVTGATGFLGKVLLEKLLRTTEVRKVAILVRSKKGKSAQQRINDYFDDAIFVKLKEGGKSYLNRVAWIESDVSQIGLGLQPDDRTFLQDEVEVVFHCAATVKFDETLHDAVTVNVRGTKELLLLTRKCTKLKAFVYVSTVYSNCTRKEITEEFFEPPMTCDDAIKLTECLTRTQSAQVSKSICGDYPNTYVFTKALAENVVNVYGEGMPVVVFRPAIVVATAEEPVQGWINNVYGPTGVQVGVGAGVLRVFQVNRDINAELVPVDMVCNAVIASAWDRSCMCQEETPVYNYVSSCQNPLTWGDFIDLSLKYGRESPTIHGLWYYMTITTKSSLAFTFYVWLLHFIPALIVDTFLRFAGKKPGMWDIYQKIYKFSSVIAYFSTNRWRFHNKRVIQLWSKMSEQDRKLFNFDISSINWDVFLSNTIKGLRVSFFKDTPDTIPAGRRKQFRFYLMHHFLLILLLAALTWTFWGLFSVTAKTYTYVCGR